ncbi:carboxymethylenebutenolidase, partial [Tremellales sp. Uapishka_1]
MSEQTEVAPCCISGHIHEGTPLGSISVLHGLRTYITPSPATNSSSEKQDIILLIPDIFGIDLVNTKLVADEWAGHNKNWKVLLPDVFEGDAIPESLLKTIAPNLRDQAEATVVSKAADTAKMAASLGPWLVKHREAVARPIVEGFVQNLKADPSTGKIAAIGFCWGGRYSLLLASPESPTTVDVAVAFHPSFLVNADVEPINKVPCAILKGTADAMMTDDALDQVEEILAKNLGRDKLLVKKYQDAVHGFSVRGDDMIPEEKKQKEDGNKEAMEFVDKWFKA